MGEAALLAEPRCRVGKHSQLQLQLQLHVREDARQERPGRRDAVPRLKPQLITRIPVLRESPSRLHQRLTSAAPFHPWFLMPISAS